MGFWARLGKVYLYSQISKPITTARRQVMMKRIACTIEEVEMLICINMVGRADVMLTKKMEKGEGSGLGFGDIALIDRGLYIRRGRNAYWWKHGW